MSYVGNQPLSVAFLVDTFNGTGLLTTFTMTVAPANTSSIIVAITGVLQDPSTYSVSGTTLTFSAAPPSGTSNISVRYLGIPASGVTTTAYRTVTEFTATAGQTSFSVASYTVGFIDVYRNGVRLNSADYTATTGTTVVLTSGATSGDTVTTMSFLVSSVLNAIPATAGSISSTYLASSLSLTTPTLTSPTINGTPVMGASVITSGTSQASTSGTSIDFTSIPSWVKRITVMFNGVSTSGTSLIQIQIGSGSVTTSGYACSYSTIGSAAAAGSTATSGFIVTYSVAAANAYSGLAILALVSSNSWLETSTLTIPTAGNHFSAGSIALGGTLDRIRITTVNGTDTFDAGSINILYE